MLRNADQMKKVARDVYRVLGSGFSEEVYDHTMQVATFQHALGELAGDLCIG